MNPRNVLQALSILFEDHPVAPVTAITHEEQELAVCFLR